MIALTIEKVIILFFSYFFLFLTTISLFDVRKKINYLDIIFIIIAASLNVSADILNESLLKGLVTFLSFVLFSLRRTRTLKESTANGFIIYVYAIIVDIFSAIIVSMIGFTKFIVKGNNLYLNKLLYFLILCEIMYIIINIKFIKKFFKFIYNYFVNSKYFVPLVVLISALFETAILISLTHTSGFKENFLSFLLMIGIGLGVFLIIYNLTKRNELKLVNQNLVLNNESFMKMINNYKMFKHNFKYELNAISTVGNKKVKDLIKTYLDEYDEEVSFDLSDLSKLPDGIRSLVYRKLLESKSLSCNVVVDNFLKYDPFEYLSVKKICTLTQCMGIILDNAIEEALETDDKYIYLKLFENENHDIVFTCCNQIKNSLDIDLVGFEKTSSKTEHMGIGTTYLAKQKLFNIKNNIVNDQYIVTVEFNI